MISPEEQVHSEERVQKNLSRPSSSFVPLTHEWSEHSIPYRFSYQVRLSPEHTAICTDRITLSYRALDQYSNRIANEIVTQLHSRGQAVAMLLDHESNVPAAILGILKSGNFYLSLDAQFPASRNRFLLEDSDAGLIVTNSQNLELAKALASRELGVINIDKLKSAGVDQDPKVIIEPDSLAYLIYTSGSTGQPKGVIHTHRSVLHKTMRHTNGWCLRNDDRVALLFSYNFGASASNLFVTLLNGATLYPFDVRNNSPAKLVEWLGNQEITLFHTVPTFFRYLTSCLEVPVALPNLRLIRLAGETIYGSDVKLFQEYFPEPCVLQVGMGSTETGTILQDTYLQCSKYPDGVVAPGFATEDMQLSIVDGDGLPVANGAVGEITVRSKYIFSGYWRRPDLTESVLSAARDNSEEWIYRTRDLGRRLQDGRISHLGRKDAQIKIRGHRVDIGEIEFTLLNLSNVRQAAVVAAERKTGENRLIAYVVSENEMRLSEDSLRESLREYLPQYMIPAAFVFIDSLPVTAGGKVDRANLTKRRFSRVARKTVAPRDHSETHLFAIWQEVLKSSNFGVLDDFFDLGGDSLLAMQMAMRVEEEFGKAINLANFPRKITIETLGDALMQCEKANFQKPVLAIKDSGSHPPLFFLHGDYFSGGAYCRNLAQHLHPEQPFYAIPPHGLDGQAVPPTIEAMAADRVRAVKSIQAAGPYRLGGFCWGGTVALEMARQLKAQGDIVEALVVIDNDPRNIQLRPVRKQIHRLCRLLSLSEEQELSLFTKYRKISEGWSGAGRGLSNKARYLSAKALRIDRVMKVLFPPELKPATVCSAESRSIAVDHDRHSRWPTYHEIHHSYVSEPYDGNVILFRSKRLQDRYPGDPRAGWRYITQSVKTCSIEGDHWTCVTTHADDVAKKMSTYLLSLSEQ